MAIKIDLHLHEKELTAFIEIELLNQQKQNFGI